MKDKILAIVESHIEKVALALAVLVLGWVVYAHFITPPGVEVGTDVMKATEAAEAAAKKAEEVVSRMSTPDTTTKVDVYQPKAKSVFSDLEPYKPEFADNIKIMPDNIWGTVQLEEDRLYRVPEILAFSEIEVSLTEGVAEVPVEPDESLEVNDFNNRRNPTVRNVSYKEEDVSFVTVAAKYPMNSMYELYMNNFGPGVANPVKLPEPVIAYIDLQRRSLKADGGWTEFESVSRLSVDPMAVVEQAPAAINAMSNTQFNVIMNDRLDYTTQLSLVQPVPFELVEGEWQVPFKPELPANAGPGGRGATDTRGGRGGAIDTRGGRGVVDTRGGGRGAALDTRGGRGDRGGRGGVGATTQRTQTRPESFKTDEFAVWAFDGNVKPGGVYSYQLRIGFFNPIAGHDWFTEAQKNLKYQRILWSEPIAATQIIKVPRKTLFFPKASSNQLASAGIRMDVYRKQGGQWYNRTFTVAPGSEIGSVVTEKVEEDTTVRRNTIAARGGRGDRGGIPGASTAAKSDTVDVNYSTGVTIIDIKPNSKRWYISTNVAKPVEATEIVYLDIDGQIKSISDDKALWPDELSKMQSQIRREIKAQEDEREKANERNNLGGRGAMDTRGGRGGMDARGGRGDTRGGR